MPLYIIMAIISAVGATHTAVSNKIERDKNDAVPGQVLQVQDESHE